MQRQGVVVRQRGVMGIPDRQPIIGAAVPESDAVPQASNDMIDEQDEDNVFQNTESLITQQIYHSHC
jgi:hypothetical protein